ncbi:hypothetical protein [Deinococcus hopiensis]|nr:hypothetical protein [Deinococcus hopiensis]
MPAVDAYHAQVTAAGADVVEPAQDSPLGRLFTVVTPTVTP